MAEEAQVALLLCEKHESEEMDIYCITCKLPKCIKCLPTDHHEHDVDTIPKLYRKIKNGRLDRIRELNAKIKPILTKNSRHIRHIKCGNETLLKEHLDNAERKRAEIHKAVDELIDSHIDRMRTHNATLDEEINKEVEHLQEDEMALVKMLDTFEKTTMVGLDLIEYYEKLRTKADNLKTLDLSQYLSRQLYTEGEIDRTRLQEMVGMVETIMPGTNNVEIISSFQQTDTPVNTIIPTSTEDAWLIYKNTGEFRFLNRNGHHIKSVKRVASGLSFIAQDNDFLCCNHRKMNILKIDMCGKSSMWIDTSPLEAREIGEALNGNVLISLVDEMSGVRTESSQRRVQMVSSGGNLLHSYENGKDNTTPVLTRPIFLTQNYNSDVCVVNVYEIEKNNWRGKVCVFYEDGELRFVYSGLDGNFYSIGICCDSLCNILCVSYNDNTIHVVSSDGLFLKYLFSDDSCIPKAYTLALHRGILWVGSKTGEVGVYRYGH